MPGPIVVSFPNRGSFIAKMNKKINRIGNARAPMNDVLDLVERSIIEGVTVSKTDVDEKSFHKLSRVYSAKKTRKFGSKPILVASGEMLDKKHFKKQATKKVGVIEYKAPTKIMTRARTHQEPITWEGPQRKWWGLRAKIIPLIKMILGKHVGISVRA